MRASVAFVMAFFLLLFSLPDVHAAEVTLLTGQSDDEWPFQPDEELLEIWIPQIHGADAALILCGGASAAIDCADAGHASSLIVLANAFSGGTVDTLFISHPHHDHIGGLQLLSAFTHVSRMMTCFPADINEHMINALYTADAAGIQTVTFADGDAFPIGSASLRVILCADADWTLNERSAVMRLEYGECSMLFTADIDEKTIRRLVREPWARLLPADILKAPHHGITGIRGSFLQLVSPGLIIVTDAAPSRKDAERIAPASIDVLYTGESVTRLASDGRRWAVEQIPLSDIPSGQARPMPAPAAPAQAFPPLSEE